MAATLDEKLELEKKRYLDFVNLNKKKHLYIYGAGKQAKAIADFFHKEGIAFEAYCVTDKNMNRDIENGRHVLQVDELPYKNDQIAFIIGVRNQLTDEIIAILKCNGYDNYLPSSDLVRYLGSYGYDIYTSPMVEITTILGCAVNCKYCPQEVYVKEYLKKKDAARILTFENFKKCIDKLPQNTFVEFAGFTEPFFNDWCMDMVRYASNSGRRVNMFTTLRGVTSQALNELLKIHFEEFVLHVPDEEGYSVIPITEEYKSFVRTLVAAKKTNGEPFIDYACAQGSVPESIKDILGKDTRVYVVLNDRAGNLKDSGLYSQHGIKGRIRCELASDINHNVLLPDGRMVLCSNDWGMKHVLGNLLEQSYDSIINGKVASYVRKSMDNEKMGNIICRKCFQAIDAS